MTVLGRFAISVAFVSATLCAAQSNNAPATVNWPMYNGNPARTGFNRFETTINPTNARNLIQSWVGIMGDLVDMSSPVVVNGVVYIASFDGKLYAFNADGCGLATCFPLWSGATGNDIVSSPAVAQGSVFIGSTDHKFYAFAANGCG